MVDGLHIHIQNRTIKPLAIALRWVGRGSRQRDCGGNLTNVQCKPILNCHNESPLYNEFILIKMKEKINKYKSDIRATIC
jgi:hypothetical protein